VKLPSVPKAIGTGFAAGVAAVLLWLAFAFWPHLFVLPYVAALCVTIVCGAYILLATWYDSYRNPRRGARIKPIRGFDIVSGLILSLPAAWALYPFLPAI
jgi:hypothetical protein